MVEMGVEPPPPCPAATLQMIPRLRLEPDGLETSGSSPRPEASDLDGLGGTEVVRRYTTRFLADNIVDVFCTIDGEESRKRHSLAGSSR
jgi:hypothetical protein